MLTLNELLTEYLDAASEMMTIIDVRPGRQVSIAVARDLYAREWQSADRRRGEALKEMRERLRKIDFLLANATDIVEVAKVIANEPD